MLTLRGVVSVSISLNNFDLKQCRDEDEEEEDNEINKNDSSGAGSSETTESPGKTRKSFNKDYQRGPFYGTDNCDRVSTQVQT